MTPRKLVVPRDFVVPKRSYVRAALISLFLSLTIIQPGFAQPEITQLEANDGQVTFTDIAANDGAGITYRRTPSESKARYDAVKTASLDPETPFLPMEMLADLPGHPNGVPGVALLDYDSDGDLDIYVTNGPATNNSLYANQLTESGAVTFVDVGEAAGVGAYPQDSTGVCYGDIDNDGDRDLYVLGAAEPNVLYENQADGTFKDITATSYTGAGDLGHASCSMGDINGDGLLDIFIANAFDGSTLAGLFSAPFAVSHHNQLLLNLGGNQFEDVSASNGIQALAGLPVDEEGSALVTWAGSLVDYDLDGVSELFTADDQAGIPSADQGGVDRSYVHVYENDGSGSFIDITLDVGTDDASQWMGLAFADFNCDGNMDFFGTNMGDYAFPALGMGLPYELGSSASRWMLGNGDGTFTDPGLGDLVADPFGWGVSATDYDNDGDTDVIYYGQLDISFNVSAANPGAILQNQDCGATFTRDAVALAKSTDHNRRAVQGVATGDLNNDGFIDIVTAASSHYPEEDAPLIPFAELAEPYGSAFDDEAVLLAIFEPIAPGELRWTGYEQSPGTLSVEMNSADNGKGWVQVETMGTVGLTKYGSVNRDGVGTVITFTPEGGQSVMTPVIGGSGYASQQSHVINLGLGDAEQGVVEILWPGGNRNKLYGVNHGERVLLPELPCSYDASWKSGRTYRSCLRTALVPLIDAGKVTEREADRLLSSALRARQDYQSADMREDLDFIQALFIALLSGNLDEFLESLYS